MNSPQYKAYISDGRFYTVSNNFREHSADENSEIDSQETLKLIIAFNNATHVLIDAAQQNDAEKIDKCLNFIGRCLLKGINQFYEILSQVHIHKLVFSLLQEQDEPYLPSLHYFLSNYFYIAQKETSLFYVENGILPFLFHGLSIDSEVSIRSSLLAISNIMFDVPFKKEDFYEIPFNNIIQFLERKDLIIHQSVFFFFDVFLVSHFNLLLEIINNKEAFPFDISLLVSLFPYVHQRSNNLITSICKCATVLTQLNAGVYDLLIDTDFFGILKEMYNENPQLDRKTMIENKTHIADFFMKYYALLNKIKKEGDYKEDFKTEYRRILFYAIIDEEKDTLTDWNISVIWDDLNSGNYMFFLRFLTLILKCNTNLIDRRLIHVLFMMYNCYDEANYSFKSAIIEFFYIISKYMDVQFNRDIRAKIMLGDKVIDSLFWDDPKLQIKSILCIINLIQKAQPIEQQQIADYYAKIIPNEELEEQTYSQNEQLRGNAQLLYNILNNIEDDF